MTFSVFVFADYQILNVYGMTLLFKTGEESYNPGHGWLSGWL